jgi:ArsR family transcriptional regulator, arsenate/arsenite/antimonite-responsive transcriptional repressor / arsenate reductase (thioredoxin)
MLIESRSVEGLARRAQLHAALGDPHRLAIVDELTLSDRSPSELGSILHIESNLLAHHLGVLESVDLIRRVSSQGDRRRRYVQLVPGTIARLGVGNVRGARRLIFVCTENSARSQLAEVLWNHQGLGITATSGGTSPAARVHPGAVRAASQRGLRLRGARPRPIPEVGSTDLVITVCDKAHEAICAGGKLSHIHWSVPDPAISGEARAFALALDVLSERIESLSGHVRAN